MHLRNMWAVDGFYYLFIEEKYGIEIATEIDRKVWEVIGKIEARNIKELFDIKKMPTRKGHLEQYINQLENSNDQWDRAKAIGWIGAIGWHGNKKECK